MAGGLLRMVAKSRGLAVDVRTAGLAHHPGKPVAENAVTVMAELGIDISNEYSKPVTPQDLDWADLVVAVQRNQITSLKTSQRRRRRFASSRLMSRTPIAGRLRSIEKRGTF